MKIAAIIPARYGSTRFPGKPLADIHGVSMIRRVIDQAKKVTEFCAVIVATDDERIAKHVREYGCDVIMTSPDHPSGTDRCLEALKSSGIHADAVINIQGDEPFVDPEQLRSLIGCISREGVEIATLAKKITDQETLDDPNKVKVIFDGDGRAIYFSRHAIPFQKGRPKEEWLDHFDYHKHIGLYAYRTNVLREICGYAPSPLERAESLEQLRWLENRRSIFVEVTNIETPAIDTPEDLQSVLKSLGGK